MKITCQNCDKKYNIRDEKLPSKNFKIKCPNCNDYVHVSVDNPKPQNTKNNEEIAKLSDEKDDKKLPEGMMYCSECGKSISKDVTFCPHCGKSFEEEKNVEEKEADKKVEKDIEKKEADKKNAERGCFGCLGIIILAVMVVMFCSDNDVGKNGKLVTKEEYGTSWAFKVSEGYVYSIGRAAIFKTGGVEYQLNGAARSKGYKPINPIWRDNPNIPGTKINISPFIKLALANPK